MISVESAKVMFELNSGLMTGDNVECYDKTFSDVASIYDDNGIADELADSIAYSVSSYSDDNCNLLIGVTTIYPVTIGNECNMTRGHFHENRNDAEFYFGIQGEGLLMLMDENGYTWAEAVSPDSAHLISGKYAHRLINIGTEPLIVGACWPVSAGHDYEAVEEMPFGYRVFRENDQIIYKEVR